MLGLVAACGAAATPETITVIETVVVEKEVEGETVTVVETVEVIKEVEVEKEVEKIVEKEVVVEVEADRPKLTVWYRDQFYDEGNFYDHKLIYSWANENNVEVELLTERGQGWGERFQVGAETGVIGDVMFGMQPENVALLHSRGMLLDVTDVVESLDGVGDGYFEAGKELCEMDNDGKFYCVPSEAVPNVVYYRADWMEEAGLEPKPAESGDELFEMAEALTIPGERYGLGFDLGCTGDDDKHAEIMLKSFGGTTFDADGKPNFNSPETIAYLQLWQDVWDKGIMPEGTITWKGADNNRAFQQGEVAIIVNQSSVAYWLVENDPEMWEQTLLGDFPAGPAEQINTIPMPTYFAWSGTEHPELAKSLLEYVHNPDNRRQYLNIVRTPSTHSALQDLEVFEEEPKLKAFQEQFDIGVSLSYPSPLTLPYLEQYGGVYTCQAINKVLVDGWTPEEAAEWGQGELTRIYESYQ
jgi:ABC-type glycerol-3-phosphate transport system substrate-binding protein